VIYTDEQLEFLSNRRRAVLAAVRGRGRPDPAAIVPWLDEQQRIVLRIAPEKAFGHE
jgi:hypothetical protein